MTLLVETDWVDPDIERKKSAEGDPAEYKREEQTRGQDMAAHIPKSYPN